MRTSRIKTLIALFLIAGLPVFIWAVATQRIELRKKAATSEPTQICWNRVIFREIAVWPNSCKGSPRTDLVCTQVLVPLTQTELDGYMAWIKLGGPYIPGCGPAPTPTPPPGCYYKLVQCIQAPCPPILVCPSPTYTPTGVPTKTPTPTYTAKPDLIIKDIRVNRIDPPNAPCSEYMYSVEVTNIGSANAPISRLKTVLNPAQPQAFNACSSFPMTTGADAPIPQSAGVNYVPPGSTETFTDYFNPMTDTTVSISAYADYYNQIIESNKNNNSLTKTFTLAAIITTTPTPTPKPVNLKFNVRLGGVTGAEAKGATIQVKLKLKDGTVLPLDTPLVLNPVGNGVYEATATLSNPLAAGTAMRVLIKGEKHSQIVFCRQSGQTDPCNDTDYITPSSYSFDFTGRPLPPGDLNQDGKVNANDLKLITDLFNKTSTQLTAQDLKTADVDYSGTIDAFDLNLVLQTLETRYDEQ